MWFIDRFVYFFMSYVVIVRCHFFQMFFKRMRLLHCSFCQIRQKHTIPKQGRLFSQIKNYISKELSEFFRAFLVLGGRVTILKCSLINYFTFFILMKGGGACPPTNSKWLSSAIFQDFGVVRKLLSAVFVLRITFSNKMVTQGGGRGCITMNMIEVGRFFTSKW